MSQQINLVNASLLPQKKILSAALMVRAVGGFLLLFCLAAGYLFQQTNKLEAERADWTKRADDAKNSMTQVAQQFPPRQPSPMLQAEIKNIEEKIQSRDRVFDVLKSGVVGKTQGFSPLLEAFARQSVNGLWLTGISMNGAGDQMRIGGNALSADLIPQYISRLSTEPALRGRNFTAFQVGQPKPIAPVAGIQPVIAAVMPSYVEFALTADKVADKPLDAVAKSPTGIKQ
jgi:hypothetical protein